MDRGEIFDQLEKDPMRDSLLSSEGEVEDQDAISLSNVDLEKGSPDIYGCNLSWTVSSGFDKESSQENFNKIGSKPLNLLVQDFSEVCNSSEITESCGTEKRNIEGRELEIWSQSSTTDQHWEGLGQCRDVVERFSSIDSSVLAKQEHSKRQRKSSIKKSQRNSNFKCESLQSDMLSSDELEFDYWEGQFEFCSPELQDYPTLQINLLERLSWESSHCSGNVYKELINTVKILQNKVEVLGDTHNDSQDRILRVKQDNSMLQTRLMVLEEQLREAEQRAEARLSDEQRRNKELIQRIENEKQLTIENCNIKQKNLEETNKRLEAEVHRLREKTEKHYKERCELEDKALEAEQKALSLVEENKKILTQTKKEVSEEQNKANKIITELRADVERLSAALETSARTRLSSTDSTSAGSEHLTAALHLAREENRSLQEQVDELQAQLLTRGLEEGRELVTAVHNNSLAAEFEAMSQEEDELTQVETVEELQKSLRDAQEVNKHLRTYIDGILLNIVENYPQLLEVKQKPS